MLSAQSFILRSSPPLVVGIAEWLVLWFSQAQMEFRKGMDRNLKSSGPYGKSGTRGCELISCRSVPLSLVDSGKISLQVCCCINGLSEIVREAQLSLPANVARVQPHRIPSLKLRSAVSSGR
ncbi:hypothetical protein FB567DRAFT_271286 [Paraphoma chrysanthemicola]|uniref:Uncharacterized protein n=1 Tax=Paraphoma chrysanthemicola TaxID=798071 RepID=A0A8K0RC27_9PLEO|nr:hypothetical protein FB567DRAFT_271286 [Paraphoma chrysanthemicola]